ncbi:MAG: AhpC/TSA family protein [Bacteroidales bacterium]|nr:AhpC/TSA family protein [Bacteroidales bacterium]
MKKLFLIAAVAGLAACTAQPETGYTVNVTATGDLAQLPTDTLIFTGGTRKSPVVDTLVLVEGKCTIKGETDTPTYYSLAFKGQKRAFNRFFLENEKFDITFDAAKPAEAVVEGGTIQAFINDYTAKREELYAAYGIDSLMRGYPKATEEEKAGIEKIYNKWQDECEAMQNAYMAENPVSDYTLGYIASEVGNLPIEEVEAKLAAFDSIPAFAENLVLKEAKETAALIKSLQPGNQAPDFVQNDPDGKPVKFSDIYSKNKLTMVDFWASWCGPCRAFNPELVKIYKKYHKKGFEILGVSNDNTHEAWVKGIKDDKLVWPQVSDLKGWDNEVGKMYYVRYIPQNIFVDQNGKIVGRQIDKPEVEKFIGDFLSK